MARYCTCDMCGAHFDITERLNEVVFTDSTGYMDKAFDLCGECYLLLQNAVKSFAKMNINDVIKTLNGIGV